MRINTFISLRITYWVIRKSCDEKSNFYLFQEYKAKKRREKNMKKFCQFLKLVERSENSIFCPFSLDEPIKFLILETN